MVALFEAGETRSEAVKAERFIKAQKSKTFILKLLDPEFKPSGHLAHLVRVPNVRD
jgi:putative endonuclease